MTKSNITEYDKVAANNTDVQDVPLGENQMYPADVNNAFREVMADLADVNDGTVALTSPKATAFEVTNNITVGGTVDGRDVATDGTKLDGVEVGATADQTAAEIRTLVDSATDSNVFTDADHSKLDGIAAGAEVNTVDSVNTQTGAVVLDAADVGALALTGGTLTGDLSFGDNDKAIFGAGSDLEISHNGSNSLIKDNGTGNLNLVTDGTYISLLGASGAQNMARFQNGGTVELFHNGNKKLNTTSTGIDVTGTVTADGGTFSGVLNINASTGYGNLEMGGPSGAFIDFKSPASDDYDARLIYNGSYFIVGTGLDQPVLLQHNNSTKLNTNSTGVSVTGNLDASDGIFVGGTNSYIYEGAANRLNFRIGADGPYAEMIDVGGGVMEFGNAGGELALTAAGTERARLTSTGLGIETTSPFSPLHLGTGESSPSASGNMADNGLTISNGSGGRAIQIGVDDTAQGAYIQSGYVNNSNVANSLSFYNGANESMTITSDGNVVFQVGINAQTGTTYTTVLADQSKLVTLTNASAITVTIPANSSVAYPVGTKIDFAQLGAGQVTFAGAGGVTVNSTPTLKLRDQYSGASCIKTATDTWLLVGDLASS